MLNKHLSQLESLLKEYLSAYPKITKSITILGALVIISKILSLSTSYYKGLLRPIKSLTQLYGPRSWIIITGATNGIGRAFAEEFASRDFNICIIAKNLAHLTQTKDELNVKYPNCSIKIIQIDYSKSNSELSIYDKIYQDIKDLDVSILINNVGMYQNMFFHEEKIPKLIEMITVNCSSQALMTSMIVKKFLERRKKVTSYKCAIINISGAEGVYPLPYLSLYSATKAFNDFLSRSLAHEYSNDIDVLSVTPFHPSSSTYFTVLGKLIKITPEDCAKAALRNLGYEQRTFGHWKHQIVGWVVELMPKMWLNLKAQLKGRKKVKESQNIERRFQQRRKNIDLQSA